MYNTIILKHDSARLTANEYSRFCEGDLIFGADSNAKELQRWSIDQEQDAKEELAKYKCSYKPALGGDYYIEEYALEYCECDENGEFDRGSDFNLAEKAVETQEEGED